MSLFTTLVGGKLLIGALAVGSVAVGGTAAAAATGELPTALQQQAHSVFGAPAPKAETSTETDSTDATETDSTDATETDSTETDSTETDSTDSESTGPTDTQSADTTTTSVAVPASAHGLCTAWSKGGLAVTSVAYTTLVTAAGGSATDISAWCLPHLVAPGHAKHTSQQSDGTSDGSEPTTSHGQGHHTADGTGDSVSSDDQQGDDSVTQQGDTGSGSDDQGDASTSTHGGSGSHGGGGHSSGSDD
jgi:hypothetical protein